MCLCVCLPVCGSSSRTYGLTWHKLNTIASSTRYTNYREKNETDGKGLVNKNGLSCVCACVSSCQWDTARTVSRPTSLVIAITTTVMVQAAVHMAHPVQTVFVRLLLVWNPHTVSMTNRCPQWQQQSLKLMMTSLWCHKTSSPVSYLTNPYIWTRDRL